MRRTARAKVVGVTQAKVIRAGTGETEYYYSIPRVPWWRLSQRRWIKSRLTAMRAEEQR